MRGFLAAPAVVAVSLMLAPAAGAQLPPPAPPPPPPPPEPRIAPGVSSGGVDLGGLTVPEATAKLRAELTPGLRLPLTVRVAGRRFRLRMRSIRLRFDPARTSRRALTAGSRRAPPFDIRPSIYFNRGAVRRFVRRVGRAVYLAPRNATLRITLRGMIRRRSYGGRKLNQNELGAALLRAVRDPRKPRALKGRRRRVQASVEYRDLERIYRTVLTIDRRRFTLRLFKRLRYDRSYPIAVGMAGYETPAGLFRIRSKQVNPAWNAPNRPWAEPYAGKTIPGGAPNNPLRARSLGVASGVGIHGTAEPWSIGTRASHGCIRMQVPDVIDLYARVPLGAPVLIR